MGLNLLTRCQIRYTGKLIGILNVLVQKDLTELKLPTI